MRVGSRNARVYGYGAHTAWQRRTLADTAAVTLDA